MSEAASSHGNTQHQLLARMNEDEISRRHTKASTNGAGSAGNRNSKNNTSLDENNRQQKNPQIDHGGADSRQHTGGNKVSPPFLKKRNNERPATQLRRKTNITRTEHHADHQLEVNNGVSEVVAPQEKENTIRGSSSNSSPAAAPGQKAAS